MQNDLSVRSFSFACMLVWYVHHLFFRKMTIQYSQLQSSSKRKFMFVVTAVMLHALEMCFQFLQLGTHTGRRKIKLMWTWSIEFISSVKPDNVTLERNTTENIGCNDMWVNFTCKSSEASPPVHNYLLLKNNMEVSFSKKGTWIEKVSQGDTFVYKCQAYQQIENVNSTNISISVKGKIWIC